MLILYLGSCIAVTVVVAMPFSRRSDSVMHELTSENAETLVRASLKYYFLLCSLSIAECMYRFSSELEFVISNCWRSLLSIIL